VVDANKFSGLYAIPSGPAGGVVGYASTAYDRERPQPVIGFDMGGTSTDVSRYDGHFDHIMEMTTAGVTIQSPQLDICTIAAGGESLLFWENGLFRVGPESAGASPGPACYRKGGPLTVTDANVLLGRLLPSDFPHIFGPDDNLPLDTEIERQKFEEVADLIRRDTGTSKTPEDVAVGFLRIATEAMCSPIRTLSEARGHETASHNLACFGEAGGQVACSIATALGIRRVMIHKSASVLSAFGIALAGLVEEAQLWAASHQVQCLRNRDPSSMKGLPS
jgi:5-oxoprolinase (ATP-hydrolysing)